VIYIFFLAAREKCNKYKSEVKSKCGGGCTVVIPAKYSIKHLSQWLCEFFFFLFCSKRQLAVAAAEYSDKKA